MKRDAFDGLGTDGRNAREVLRIVAISKDLLAGLIFICIAAAFGTAGLSYPLGTAFQMGPGYFPLVLSFLLGLIGFAIAIKSFVGPHATIGNVRPRSFTLLLAPILFGLTVRGVGLGPAVAMAVLISAFATGTFRLPVAIVSALVISGVCYLIFVGALGIPLPAFGPWLKF